MLGNQQPGRFVQTFMRSSGAAFVAGIAAVGLACSPAADVETVTVDSTDPPAPAIAPDHEVQTPLPSTALGLDADLAVVALSEAPLSARANALGVWTGAEVLIIGGDPEAWCPPNADCAAPSFESLSDGVAIDPETATWRQLTEAPVPITRHAESVVVDGHVHVLTRPLFTEAGRIEPAFLRYDLEADSWTVLPLPPVADPWFALAAADESVVAYPGSDETGEQPDWRFDPESETWEELPADPLSPSYDRFYAVVDDDLVLLAKDLVDNPGSDGPSLAGIARLDLDTGIWVSDADRAEFLWTEAGVVVGHRVVFPFGGSSDGGQVNGWGRSVPHGGVWDTTADTWAPLSAPAVDGSPRIAGVLSADGNHIDSVEGWVLDLDTGSWLGLRTGSELDEVAGRTVVATDSKLVVFGGESWAGGEGRVLDDLYLVDLP